MRFLLPMLCIPVFLYSYTLDELIELSHKNRVVESATHLLSAKEKAYESSKSSYLPTLELGASYQNVRKETPAFAENSLKVQASLQYTIYDGGKKGSLYSQLESSIDSSRYNLEAVKNYISLDVARLYFEYLSLESDKDATNQEIEQLKAEFKRLDLFYKSGSTTKDEVAKIDSRLKNAVVTLNEIELESERILYALEYYTTQKIQKIDDGSAVTLNEQDKVARADIEALKYDVLSLLHEAETKKSENLPIIYFDNTLSYSDYYFDDKSLESSFLVETQNIAMLNLSWNIFDFGARSKEYESKFHEYLSKRSTLEHEKHRADVEYRFANKALEIAKQKVNAAKATLDAASSTYELVKFKYQNGTIDNVAYLESMSEKYDAARAHKRALFDLEVKKAELIYYSGQDIKEFL